MADSDSTASQNSKSSKLDARKENDISNKPHIILMFFPRSPELQDEKIFNLKSKVKVERHDQDLTIKIDHKSCESIRKGGCYIIHLQRQWNRPAELAPREKGLNNN